ncbi:MAG: AbrB family transcriptional regulator [Candidatus Bathyarchaeia archaeon]
MKKVDSQGRVSIPAKWRSRWKSNKVLLKRLGEVIEITPLELTPPSELFDSIVISDEVDFSDSHSIRKALMELKEH